MYTDTIDSTLLICLLSQTNSLWTREPASAPPSRLSGPLKLLFVLTQRQKRHLNYWKYDVLRWFGSAANYCKDGVPDFTLKPLASVCLDVDLNVLVFFFSNSENAAH